MEDKKWQCRHSELWEQQSMAKANFLAVLQKLPEPEMGWDRLWLTWAVGSVPHYRSITIQLQCKKKWVFIRKIRLTLYLIFNKQKTASSQFYNVPMFPFDIRVENFEPIFFAAKFWFWFLFVQKVSTNYFQIQLICFVSEATFFFEESLTITEALSDKLYHSAQWLHKRVSRTKTITDKHQKSQEAKSNEEEKRQ